MTNLGGNPLSHFFSDSDVLMIMGEEADLPVQLLVKGNLALLLALFQMADDGVKVLQRESFTGLESGPFVVGKSHRQVVVNGLEVQLVTDNNILLIGLIGIELLQAVLGSSLEILLLMTSSNIYRQVLGHLPWYCQWSCPLD